MPKSYVKKYIYLRKWPPLFWPLISVLKITVVERFVRTIKCFIIIIFLGEIGGNMELFLGCSLLHALHIQRT